jgi:hypothetical protein
MGLVHDVQVGARIVHVAEVIVHVRGSDVHDRSHRRTRKSLGRSFCALERS